MDRRTTGRVRVIDFMPVRDTYPEVIRIVECLEGHVRMRTELVVRFDYGSVVPWVRRTDDGTVLAVGGPDALCIRTPVELHGEAMTHVADFNVRKGDRVPFVATWYPSARPVPGAGRRRAGAARDGAVLARLDAQLPLRRRLSGRGAHVADGAEGADVRADRRHRRRTDDVAARVDRRARATGTTATAGCAMRRSRSTR